MIDSGKGKAAMAAYKDSWALFLDLADKMYI